MTTLSEPSAPSPTTSSATSPYFTEPLTPAQPPTKKSHSRRRPPGHIPRPRNAFILFRSHYVAAQLIPSKVENDHRHISKVGTSAGVCTHILILGVDYWRNLEHAATRRATNLGAEGGRGKGKCLLDRHQLDAYAQSQEKHSRLYPDYRYKPAKLEGVVKRRVKCRGAQVLSSPYSSTPGIGNAPRELVGSLNLTEGGSLRFVDNEKTRFIDQEERRKDPTRCSRVAELVKQGVVGKRLEQEAQRLGLDRESAMAGAPQLEPSVDDLPGTQGHFHTNDNVLRALGELEDDVPVFTNPFARQGPQITLNPRFFGAARENRSPPNARSPVDTHGLGGSPMINEPRASSTNSSGSDNDEADRRWPHRRASPLSLPPLPPIYREIDAYPHLLIVESQQSEPDFQAPAHPPRSSSSSPTQRPDPTQDLCPPRKEKATEKPQKGHENMDVFKHLSYPPPTTSPPEYFYSPHAYPHLQLNYPPLGVSPHATLLSPLYGIDVVRGEQHQQEPIDLSAMYESDIPNGNDSTLHSTYATPAEKALSPISAASAPDQGPSAREQVRHQVPNSALGFSRSPGPSGTYDWHATYGTEYHPPQYHTNDACYDEEGRHPFTSRMGSPTY
ncbi:hypothetical protein FS749_000740 [Ceratobasidium sp. UAMH 11750]|nr:hypothetical protein FS749_000740 [Ceratobasidium sp. UAMH 11750]